MNKVFNCNIEAGSKMNEPKLTSEALNECLNSNEPLAKAFRQWVAEHEAAKQTDETGKSCRLFKDIFPNTELGVDLKLMTCKPGRMEVGDLLGGVITRDGEEHYTFLENAKVMRRLSNPRNPLAYHGTTINIHRKADGTLYPTFNRPAITDDYSFALFCCEAAEELIFVAGLLGKEATK